MSTTDSSTSTGGGGSGGAGGDTSGVDTSGVDTSGVGNGNRELNRLQFVFVSACHSRRAGEAFIAAGVPHVVCIKVDSKILDRAARVFTRAFYLSLVVGDTLADAFSIGRQAVYVSQMVEAQLGGARRRYLQAMLVGGSDVLFSFVSSIRFVCLFRLFVSSRVLCTSAGVP